MASLCFSAAEISLSLSPSLFLSVCIYLVLDVNVCESEGGRWRGKKKHVLGRGSPKKKGTFRLAGAAELFGTV